MKRTLAIFSTLAAFTGIASAQSSVILYGLIDLNYQYLKSGSKSPLGGEDLHRLSDGSLYGPGSRWGMRVQEDLGGGLKANAVLEGGISADTGALGNSGRAFGRQVFVSLASSSLGEIRLGRQYSLQDEVMGLSNPFSNTTVLNPGAAANTLSTGVIPLFINPTRIDNVVEYLSPILSGFRLQASVAPGEGLVDRYQGVKGSYASGPLNAAFSYEWSQARVGTAGVSVAGDTVNKILQLGANYNFDSFKIFGGYQGGNNLTPGSSAVATAPVAVGGVGTQVPSWAIPGLTGPATQLKAYTLGVSVPVGAAVLATNYTLAEYDNDASTGRTLGRFGVAGTYSFSKLTLMYAGLALHTGDINDYINEKTIFQLGLRKAF